VCQNVETACHRMLRSTLRCCGGNTKCRASPTFAVGPPTRCVQRISRGMWQFKTHRQVPP
jgi:hypothetical protein